MNGYIVDFTVYTLAMIGVIFIAFVVAKKTLFTANNANKNNDFLSVESSLSIAPRKTIHVVNAGGEKFLIASDLERTAFLTKLGAQDIKDTRLELGLGSKDIDLSNRVKSTKNNNNKSIMRSMLAKLGE